MSLSENLAQVRLRIEQACSRCGRGPSSITLVAVTKGIEPGLIREAVSLGIQDLGENRVQEAREKQGVLGSRLKAPGEQVGLQPPTLSLQPVRWHLIGHLQRNKVRAALGLFDVIHSVDSIELADALERIAAEGSKEPGTGGGAGMQRPQLFVQVNVSGERAKFGCQPTEALALARHIVQQPHLSLKGFMTMAPYSESAEDARPHFRRLCVLRDEAARVLNLEPPALSLSMGMSQDFEVAIEEGADVVRIGTALFGGRGQEAGGEGTGT